MDAALASESQCVAFESVCHNGVIPRCCLGSKGSWEGRIPAERSPKTPDQAPFLLNFYGRSFLANFVSTSNLSVEHILWDTTAKKVQFSAQSLPGWQPSSNLEWLPQLLTALLSATFVDFFWGRQGSTLSGTDGGKYGGLRKGWRFDAIFHSFLGFRQVLLEF